jgi:cilia- and flagella-associated protein 57
MHPSGLQVLVGFNDKLRLMNLLMDDIRVAKEVNIRGCRECCFSHGGHLFAAVQGNIIQIFNTYTLENVGNLKVRACVCAWVCVS